MKSDTGGTCAGIRDLLSAHLDGELDALERRAIDAHLRDCEACRAERESLAATVALLKSLPRDRAPQSLLPAVRAGMAKPAGRIVSFPRAGTLLRWSGLAAGLLLAVTVGIFMYSEDTLAPRRTEAPDSAPAPAAEKLGKNADGFGASASGEAAPAPGEAAPAKKDAISESHGERERAGAAPPADEATGTPSGPDGREAAKVAEPDAFAQDKAGAEEFEKKLGDDKQEFDRLKRKESDEARDALQNEAPRQEAARPEFGRAVGESAPPAEKPAERPAPVEPDTGATLEGLEQAKPEEMKEAPQTVAPPAVQRDAESPAAQQPSPASPVPGPVAAKAPSPAPLPPSAPPAREPSSTPAADAESAVPAPDPRSPEGGVAGKRLDSPKPSDPSKAMEESEKEEIETLVIRTDDVEGTRREVLESLRSLGIDVRPEEFTTSKGGRMSSATLLATVSESDRSRLGLRLEERRKLESEDAEGNRGRAAGEKDEAEDLKRLGEVQKGYSDAPEGADATRGGASPSTGGGAGGGTPAPGAPAPSAPAPGAAAPQDLPDNAADELADDAAGLLDRLNKLLTRGDEGDLAEQGQDGGALAAGREDDLKKQRVAGTRKIRIQIVPR